MQRLLTKPGRHRLLWEQACRGFFARRVKLGLAEKLENTRKNKKIGEKKSLRVFSSIPKTYVFGISHIKWLFSSADN
jgi:hypothetical protein